MCKITYLYWDGFLVVYKGGIALVCSEYCISQLYTGNSIEPLQNSLP